MLIVCTHDNDIINWTGDPRSESHKWSPVYILDGTKKKAGASTQLGNFLTTLGQNESLCLSAHGNDAEIGDEGSGPKDWGWTCAQIANLLGDKAPGFKGNILIHACAKTVSNFSAGLAVALQAKRALKGVWIYGYKDPIGSNQRYPDPADISKHVSLQGTQVLF